MGDNILHPGKDRSRHSGSLNMLGLIRNPEPRSKAEVNACPVKMEVYQMTRWEAYPQSR